MDIGIRKSRWRSRTETICRRSLTLAFLEQFVEIEAFDSFEEAKNTTLLILRIELLMNGFVKRNSPGIFRSGR